MRALIVLAFGAGLLTPLSPCGFALLPAYLAAFLNPGGGPVPAPARLRRALGAAGAITAGFTATLTSIGAALAAGLGTVIHLIPWAAAALGVVLITTGTAMLAGRAIRLPARFRVPRRLRLPGIRPPASGDSTPAGWWRLAGFGAGYAFAAMSCTLAVLLSMVTQALTAGTLATTIGVFAAYAAGSAVLLLALAATAVLAGSALSGGLGRLTRHLPRISGVLLAASGLYLTIYWIPALLRHSITPSADPLSAASAAITAWISAHQNLVAGGAGLLVTTTVIATAMATRRTRPDRPNQPDPCCAPGNTPAGEPEHHTADPAGQAR